MSTNPGAYGTVLGPQISRTSGAIQTPFGVLLPPTMKVAAYVRSGGVQDQDDDFIRNNLVTTLNEGLKRCRSGLGDTVYVLPDHAENISTADQMSSLVAGTKIIGLGTGNLRPTFTWTAAAATFLFDVANVALDNCILKMADAGNAGVTVAAPITVSAAGCSISNCRIMYGADADDDVTIAITTTAAADNFSFIGNHCFAADAAPVTTFLRLVGADYLHMANNLIIGTTGNTAIGVVQMLTTASTEVLVENCSFVNRIANSTAAFTDMAAATGVVRDCDFGIVDNATTAGTTANGALQYFRCQVVNTDAEGGIDKTPVSA